MTTPRKHGSKPGPKSRTFGQGYEPGSIASRLSTEEMRKFKEWLKQRQADSQIFCMQLTLRDPK